MWKLINKNFKIVVYSKFFLMLPLYALYLAIMKIPKLGWSPAANVVVTFVLIGSFSSMVEGVGKKSHTDEIFFSLPLTRKDHLYADYVMTLIYIIFAICYIMVCNWILDWILPDNLLDIRLVTAGECIYIFLIIAMISFIEGLMPSLSGLEHTKKGFFFLYLMAIIALSLWIYPILIILMGQGNLGLGNLSGPFALLARGLELLNQPFALGMTIAFIVIISIISFRLALRHYLRKEI